jgi:hypothetical protein
MWTSRRPFPDALAGSEVAGVDLVLLDADAAGCIGTYVAGRGARLNEECRQVLGRCLAELERVTALLDGEARAYFLRAVTWPGRRGARQARSLEVHWRRGLLTVASPWEGGGAAQVAAAVVLFVGDHCRPMLRARRGHGRRGRTCSKPAGDAHQLDRRVRPVHDDHLSRWQAAGGSAAVQRQPLMRGSCAALRRSEIPGRSPRATGPRAHCLRPAGPRLLAAAVPGR